MGRPKRSAQAAAEEALTPPDELSGNQSIVRVLRAEGNNLYTCELPNKKDMVLELAQRFRNTIWIKRGGYVLAERYEEPEGRVQGEIINVVRDEKAWRRQSYWCVSSPPPFRDLTLPPRFLLTQTTPRPKEFAKSRYDDEDDESDSNVGKMPPSDSEDDY
ncbi:eukaryotic translation initiation factor eif1a-like protein [Colletotrichum plurivorum]|uniref:Eukaryotic translation initiation factor eif1a-like protein n=1 Tax=Colletotrichum plurivorum TaxID=2175906 RepID=A0A8H6K2U9_9PEZI|nr:eukaryotic translation initiation factor eif1a-like protein [Colletotrichum plurivorum]